MQEVDIAEPFDDHEEAQHRPHEREPVRVEENMPIFAASEDMTIEEAEIIQEGAQPCW